MIGRSSLQPQRTFVKNSRKAIYLIERLGCISLFSPQTALSKNEKETICLKKHNNYREKSDRLHDLMTMQRNYQMAVQPRSMSRHDNSKIPHWFPHAAQCSFPEQIACVPVLESVKHQNIALNAVYQKSFGLNVALPVSTPVAGQVMISVLRRQRVSHFQK